MPSRILERAAVALDPERAQALWLDVRRWPSFVEGFRGTLRLDRGWPQPGAQVVWESIPGGRGRVTEKLHEAEPGRVVSSVFEERMAGRQEVRFAPAADGRGSVVEVALEYELTSRGPLRAVANALFIRRAISDSVARTLRRFAIEADEEASLAPGGGAAGA